MEQTKKERLVESFETAIEEGAKYIFVEVHAEGSPANEIIINPIENAAIKLAYYQKAYNDDLVLPHAPISVVSFGYIENLSQLEYVRNNSEVN
jgi:hypothetical protein